jgi:hypothetical protein
LLYFLAVNPFSLDLRTETSAAAGINPLPAAHHGRGAPRSLKDPQKAFELRVQEDRRKFKVEMADHMTVIHLEVQRLVHLVVRENRTFDLVAAMRA